MALIKLPGKSYNTDAVNPFVNTVFDNLFNDSFISDRLVTRVPAVNIAESESGFQIEVAAPVLKNRIFKINVDKTIMTISVEKTVERMTIARYITKKNLIIPHSPDPSLFPKLWITQVLTRVMKMAY